MGIDFESLVEATSGAVGGLVSTTILYPLDTCKTKYQAELRSNSLRKYRSLLDVLREAIAKRQLLSLYQGLGTKNLQSVISQFLYFYGYSFFRQLYLRWAKLNHMGTGANLAVGVFAGACTVLVTQPLDTASSQMQTSSFGKSRGLLSMMTGRSWKEAYVGIGVSLLLTCNPAIQYTVFEQTKRRLLRSSGRSKQPGEEAPVVLSAFRAFALGAFSKTCATVLTYPAIRVKTVIQAAEQEEDQELLVQGSRTRKEAPTRLLPAAIAIWQHQGPSGFYQGLQAQILKTIDRKSVV